MRELLSQNVHALLKEAASDIFFHEIKNNKQVRKATADLDDGLRTTKIDSNARKSYLRAAATQDEHILIGCFGLAGLKL